MNKQQEYLLEKIREQLNVLSFLQERIGNEMEIRTQDIDACISNINKYLVDLEEVDGE